jgi:hypothetical protein
MKNIALLIIISATLFNAAHAEKKWVKTTNGCTLWWATSAYDVFKAVKWSGKCKNGYASGNGVARYYMKDKTQDIFRGHMKKGKIHGYGKYRWANGNTYAGMLKKGKIEGQGTLIWANGDRYTGSWKNHRTHGKGTISWNKPYLNHYKSFTGSFYKGQTKIGMYTRVNGTKVAKRQAPPTDVKAQTSTYLDLIRGYATNRHMHYGN